MLFYSYEFILLFLPVVFLGFFGIARFSARLALGWLALASLFFYAWWDVRFILLILVSITFNFFVARYMARNAAGAPPKLALIAAVCVNLALLAYFKYMNFFVGTMDTLLGLRLPGADIVLPLGISIFTFTQIAFVSDVYRGIAREYNYIDYVLFVAYFPHLIAGPIIHHRQIMPQFHDPAIYRLSATNVAVGLTIFTIGLAKKVLLAGSFAEYANPVFDGVAQGARPGLIAAWAGTLAYTLQIYFDFSGYSDMAIGLSRLFGIVLPENFNAPYKAHNIVEFWHRWNMTLSQFLRDYLYIPLGGNRRGPAWRYVNLTVTMLLGGLWHGANWTFVAWGGLHALYLSINHGWHALRRRICGPPAAPTRLGRMVCTLLTFLAVACAWVFFRAPSVEAARVLLQGMTHFTDLAGVFGGDGGSFDELFRNFWMPHDSGDYRLGMLVCGLLLVWLAPTTRELLGRIRLDTFERAFATIGGATVCIFVLSAISASRRLGDFIYFNF